MILRDTSASAPIFCSNNGSADPDAPRLLYVATSKNDGGIERYSVQLARRLWERGAPLWYACAPDEIIARHCGASGVPTLPLCTRNSGDMGAARRLAEWIVARRIDLVHVHSRRDYVPALAGVWL